MDNKNILVTGDRGFIARYVITELLEEGYTVVGIDNDYKHGQVELPFDGVSTYNHYYGDARDYDTMRDLMWKYDIDVIISNAALIGGIKYFHDLPFDIIQQNSDIVNNTLKAAIDTDVEQVVMLSSSMVYESAKYFPVKEGDEREIEPPLSAYGFQKLQSEYAVEAAKNQYDLDYTIIRPFNAVGAGEEMRPNEPGFSHVIPDFIYKAATQDRMEIFGDGEQVRCFTHANDIAKGIIKTIGNTKALNTSYNLVQNEPIKMKELAEKIWNAINPEKKFVAQTGVKDFENDVEKRIGEPTKARRELEWHPTRDLDDILKEVINEMYFEGEMVYDGD